MKRAARALIFRVYEAPQGFAMAAVFRAQLVTKEETHDEMNCQEIKCFFSYNILFLI